jgi:hypothetical protein
MKPGAFDSAAAPGSGQAGSVSIDRLSVRLPGPGSAFGRRVVEAAVTRVAERLPAGLAGDFSSLQLTVRPERLSEDGLSEAIAEALLKALERRRP